jgi:hypothetical protein
MNNYKLPTPYSKTQDLEIQKLQQIARSTNTDLQKLHSIYSYN